MGKYGSKGEYLTGDEDTFGFSVLSKEVFVFTMGQNDLRKVWYAYGSTSSMEERDMQLGFGIDYTLLQPFSPPFELCEQ